jgi:AAHS family 4-hydroxybenzoate transporter-like MFS transporter
MKAQQTIDIQAFIDNHALSRFQIRILVLCFIIVAIDGFDTAAIGFIAPAIRADWGLTPAELAPLFGAGLFGLMGGAFLFGPLADRFGRKRILIVCSLFFALAALASAFAQDLRWLTALRFLTGLGLGGAMPNAITLTSEYCPQRSRSMLVSLMFCGFTLGSASGGLLAAQLVADWGWRSVLMLGGVLPVLFLPVLIMALPESARFLVMQGSANAKIASILARVSPERGLDSARFTGSAKPTGLPVAKLFAPQLLGGTLLLWVTFFMGLLVVYLLSSWLPTLLNGTGISLAKASLITAMFQVGGTVGAILLGVLMDRFSPGCVLATSYLFAAVFIAAMGSVANAPGLLAACVFAAGFFVSGSQVGVNTLAAAFYPTESRATGVSWANGVGRIGSIVGSLAGGVMMSFGMDIASVFGIVAVPAVIAGLAMLAISIVRGTSTSVVVPSH